ncbi:hypothetical protein HAALTHF_15920n [Vreelandella aquamarina]|nr:hypothetical protein HAALTHF_15920n [Halomonas axialensis]
MVSISRCNGKSDRLLELVATQRDDKRLLLGRGVPNLEVASLKPLSKILAGLHRSNDLHGFNYDKLSGSPELRQQVARLAVASGCLLHPDDVLITTGCQEALSIALRTLTSPAMWWR